MAGIGFELRRVINKGGLGSFFQIAMSGAMIVAGPWILSILTIMAIQTFLNQVMEGGLELFMGVVIYCYAFSLSLFGGFHYLFTRRMSDLLYLKKESQAFGYVLRLCLPVAAVSIALSAPAAFLIELTIPRAALFRFSAVMIFTTVNCLWIVMLFVSVLKWFLKILIVYTLGLFFSLLFVYLLAGVFSLAGALLGFSLGHLFILLLLVILCRASWKPEKPGAPPELAAEPGPSEEQEPPGRGEIIRQKRRNPIRDFIRYASRYRYLFGAGLLYYWGIWIDKMIYWRAFGENVSSTFIRLFPEYDMSVYLANLTMIPGLVFFVIYSETEFYTALKRFLFKLVRGSYSDILKAKRQLASVTSVSIKEQCIMQGIVTFIAVVIAGSLIFRLTLSAVFFHLLLLTLLNYLFYIEQYRHAFYAAFVFFALNTALSLLTVSGIGALPPGLSYLVSAAAASTAAAFMLKKDIFTLERHILTKK